MEGWLSIDRPLPGTICTGKVRATEWDPSSVETAQLSTPCVYHISRKQRRSKPEGGLERFPAQLHFNGVGRLGGKHSSFASHCEKKCVTEAMASVQAPCHCGDGVRDREPG